MEFFSSSLPLFFGRADELEPALPLSLDDFRLWLKEVVASFCLAMMAHLLRVESAVGGLHHAYGTE